MHIPDGYLDFSWSLLTYAVSITYLVYVVKKAGDLLDSEKVSILTVLSASIFAAQMIAWPIPGGTSLHFLGGPLAGVMMGPVLGSLAMSIVVIVQCLVFHDGGITALGANLLNMAIISVIVGYVIFKLTTTILGRFGRRAVFVGGLLGGWAGVFMAGLMCGLEIGLSPHYPYAAEVAMEIMGVWHAILGLGEGLITGLVLSYIQLRSPDLILGVER